MSCNCGCGGCQTKIQGPLLTEGKVKSLLSEGLLYHIEHKLPLFETVYRIGSDAHLSLIKEARKMYSRNVIDLCEEDEALIKTHLGEFGIYEGESVPLDLPMLNEEKKLTYNDFIRMVRDDMMAGASPDEYPSGEKVRKDAKYLYNRYLQGASIDELFEAYSGFLRNPEDPDSEKFEPTGSVAQFKEDLRRLFGKFKGELKNPEFIKGVAQIMVNWKAFLRSQLGEAEVDYDFSKEELIRVIQQLKRGASTEIGMIKAFEKALGRELTDDEIRGFKLNEAELDEAEFRGKDVPLNKPKRGGSKAYYVYVRDPKTKKIKKVSFGSGGLRAKIKNKEARNAFAKRHRCKDKKDRTKAGYWSCNLPRYASALGLGANMNTFW